MAETYMGHVQNGRIVPDEGTPPLPEGSRFLIVPIKSGVIEPGSSPKTLAERYRAIIGIAEGLPDDLSIEHDHYVHGTPRHENR